MKAFKIAVRSLLHFKSYTFVNVLGLAMSLVCTIIIFRYVYGEITVDHHNSKSLFKNIVYIHFTIRAIKAR